MVAQTDDDLFASWLSFMDALAALFALGISVLLAAALMRDHNPYSDAGGWLGLGLIWIVPMVPMFGAAAVALKRRWRWRWLVQLVPILYVTGSTLVLWTQ